MPSALKALKFRNTKGEKFKQDSYSISTFPILTEQFVNLFFILFPTLTVFDFNAHITR